MTQTDTKTKTQKPIERILDAFPDATGPNGAGWYNNPDNPRFDFRENEDGSVHIHPWTGRTIEDILGMGGLTHSDLHRNKQISPFTHPKLDVFVKKTITSPKGANMRQEKNWAMI